MNDTQWVGDAMSPSPYGAILTYLDESHWEVWNAHWLQGFFSAALFAAVVLGLYLCGRVASPQGQPFTHRRNSYDHAKQQFGN